MRRSATEWGGARQRWDSLPPSASGSRSPPLSPLAVENRGGAEGRSDFGRAVSRILSAPLAGRRESFVSAASTRNPSRRAEHGAGRSGVSYLALHPMGFSVPRRLLFERWALTPPFHPCRRHTTYGGGLFSVALSVEMPFSIPPACIPARRSGPGYAASHPVEFGLSSPIPPLRDRSDSPPFQNRVQHSR